MTALPATISLVTFAGAAMVATPRVLTARWTIRHPRATLALWFLGLFSGIAALVLALGIAVSHSMQFACESPADCSSTASWSSTAVFLLGWLLSALVGGLAGLTLYRAVPLIKTTWAVRAELARHVLLAGEQRVVARKTVHCCTSVEPIAMSIPGRHQLVMVSHSLVEALTAQELASVVEHERAHLRLGHSALQQIAHVHLSTLPVLPSAKAMDRAVALMIELIADDVAARRHGRRVTASALERVAALRKQESLELRAARLAGRLIA